ncbi:MAG: hypothetical protein EOO45_04270 [Flavobacterium sp.]|nr:MAG: hypothetical protein EOO45_04270 [Flavobacterium sp.]
MSIVLYINGQAIDTDSKTVIAQTKQVNDLNSLDTREANFTNKIKIPKTAANVRAMKFLAVTGNNSRIPYQENVCSLYSESGECFVYNGRAVVTDGGDNYDVVVYDGIIDLYKKIENKTLADLDLQGISHQKNIANIKNSWLTEHRYKYILADYNGETGRTNITDDNLFSAVNVDYLVPSVSVSWLWNQIFERFGFSYGGGVFDTESFVNLWMTYPKGTTSAGDNDQLIFESSFYSFINQGTSHVYAKSLLQTTSLLAGLINGIHMKVNATGAYRIKIKGKLYGRRGGVGSEQRPTKLYLAKNGQNAPTNSYLYLPLFKLLGTDIPYGQDFELSPPEIFTLQQFESICIVATGTDPTKAYNINTSQDNKLHVELYRVNPNVIDFGEALSDFSIRDFLNEVIQRFGLTIFPDKPVHGQPQNYTFLTLQEMLQTSDIVNWSSKFVRKLSENYTYGSYAQKNWFRYNYNDKEGSHNDGFISVDNVNLPDSRAAVSSKIYSPEKITFATLPYFNAKGNVFKLWEKEIVEATEEEDEHINYKPLDKRYYFLRAFQIHTPASPIGVYSGQLNTSASAVRYYRENFYKLGFGDIINDYYEPLKQILNDVVMVNAELYLNDNDVVNFDFKKLYYIEQLSSHFIVNKINNFITGKPVKCELVRVQYAPSMASPLPIRIYKVIIARHDIAVFYNSSLAAQSMELQVYNYSGPVWSSLSNLTNNPFPFNFTPEGNFKIRLFAEGLYSNEVDVTISSTFSTTLLIP